MDKCIFLEYYSFVIYGKALLFAPWAERRFIYMKRFIDSNRWEIVSAALISGVFTASVIIAMSVSAL